MPDQTSDRGPNPSAAARYARDTVDLALKGATAYQRDDLLVRLRGARSLLAASAATVQVVGEFKQGKSSLVNALLNADVCPVDDDLATAVPTRVGFAREPHAVATFAPGDEAWAAPRSRRIEVADLPAHVGERGNPANRMRLREVAVGVNRPLLEAGLALVDTPGVGGFGSTDRASTLSTIPEAHAVIVVSDVSAELSAAELRFLETVTELCPSVVVARTKIDMYADWRRVVDLDRNRLDALGVTVVPVSSELRRAAVRGGDRELNEESGYPELVRPVRGVTRDAERVALGAVGHHVLAVADQIEPVVTIRVQALTRPGEAAATALRLQLAEERVGLLRDRSARWQQILSDGFADLGADVDHDLRRRTRAVLHEAEKSIDDGDPAEDWPGFEAWLRGRLSAEALDVYAAFAAGVVRSASRVCEHLDTAGRPERVAPSSREAPTGLLAGIVIDAGAFAGVPGVRAGAMAGFQKGYGGFLMSTVLAHMASLAVPVPIGLGVGLLMGRVGYREERRRLLEKRRAGARTAVRRFVDDVDRQVGKDLRDGVRHVRRDLRDGYVVRVRELERSARAARDAARGEVSEGERTEDELRRLRQDLESLERLRRRATELVRHTGPRRPTAVVVAGLAG